MKLLILICLRSYTKVNELIKLLHIIIWYIKITEILDIEGRPIVAGSIYYTHGVSILIHKIMG